ncbi:discoidin domain-containing protein [Intestinibacter sp.]
MSTLKNLKKVILLLIVAIPLSLSGCSNKSTDQTNIKENIKSQAVNDVKTLAVDDDYVTYYATASTYFSSYIPNNVLDDDSLSSWVLQDDKQGKDEWIQINFDKKIEVNKLYILNGLGDTEDNEEAYHSDNRVRVLAAEFSNGQEIEINLEDDTLKEQEITLQQPVDTTYVKFTIKDTYKGDNRPKLTCIGSIGINYPRVNGNNDLTTNFTGVYGDWDKVEDINRKLSTIAKYIDYKEGLDIKNKVQYLADLILYEYKDCYNGANITISQGLREKSLKADLAGEEFVQYYCGGTDTDMDYTFTIESNLIQYYYEGNDWIDEIKFSKNGQEFNLNKGQYLNKDYVRNIYIDDEYMYNYLVGNNEQTIKQNENGEMVCIYEGEIHFPEDVEINRYNGIKYTTEKAENRIFEYLKDENREIYMVNTGVLSDEYIDNNDGTITYPLQLCHCTDGYDRVGYIIPITPIPPEDGGFTATLSYFVDANTGIIYNFSPDSIVGKRIYPQ